MMRFLRIIPAVAVVAVIGIGPSVAADLPKKGDYDYTTCFTRNSTRIEYSKTHFAYSHEDTGTYRLK